MTEKELYEYGSANKKLIVNVQNMHISQKLSLRFIRVGVQYTGQFLWTTDYRSVRFITNDIPTFVQSVTKTIAVTNQTNIP